MAKLTLVERIVRYFLVRVGPETLAEFDQLISECEPIYGVENGR